MATEEGRAVDESSSVDRPLRDEATAPGPRLEGVRRRAVLLVHRALLRIGAVG